MRKKEQIYYILKQSNGTIWRFSYVKEMGITYEFLQESTWTEKKIIFKETSENFSVVLDENDKISLFCEDSSGNIIVCSWEKETWSKEVFLCRSTDTLHSLYFKAILQKNDIHIFYTVPNRNGNSTALVYQTALGGKEWTPPKMVDVIKPSMSNPFMIYKLQNEMIFICYKKDGSEEAFGFKTLSKNGKVLSSFSPLHSNVLEYIDFSFMPNENYIHSLYLKKERYYCTLLYERKNSDSKKAIQIFQNEQIKSCTLFMIDDHLWALWLCGNKLYSCFSTNHGESFSTPTEHKILYNNNPVKAFYLSNCEEELKHLSINEVYIYENEIADILILPELFPAILQVDMKQAMESVDISEGAVDSHLNYIKNHLSEIYEKIYLCKKQIREKEQQIFQLNYTLENRNNELLTLQHAFQKRKIELEAFSSENKELKEKALLLEQKILYQDKKLKNLEVSKVIQQQEMEKLKKQVVDCTSVLVRDSQKKTKASFFRRIFTEDDNGEM